MSVRAGAAMHRFASWDSELCAGERLRLAGYRPAQAFVRGESVRKLKTESSKTQYAVLQQEQEHHMMRPLDRKIEFSDNLRGGWSAIRQAADRRVLRSFTPAIHFYWKVLHSFTPVFFPLSGKKKRLAACFVSVPRGRNRHL